MPDEVAAGKTPRIDDRVTVKVADILKDGRRPRADRLDEALGLIVKSLTADDLKPGLVSYIAVREPNSVANLGNGPGEPVCVYVMALRGKSTVAVVDDCGEVLYFKIMKFHPFDWDRYVEQTANPPARDASPEPEKWGNDYVLLDRFVPGVPMDQ